MSDATMKMGRLRVFSTAGNCQVTITEAPGSDDLPEEDGRPADYDTIYQEGWNACQLEAEKERAALMAQIATLESENDTLQQKNRAANESLSQIPCNLAAAVQRYVDVLERDLCGTSIDIGLTIAENLTMREIEQKTIIGEVIREAVAMTVHLNDLVIYLNPGDLNEIQRDSDVVVPPSFTIREDSTLCPGELRMETDQGRIDATMSGRLAMLREQISDRIEAVYDCDSDTCTED